MEQEFRVVASGKETIVQESALFQTFADLIKAGETDEIIATSQQFHYFLIYDYLGHWEVTCSYKSVRDAHTHLPDLLEVGRTNQDGSPVYS